MFLAPIMTIFYLDYVGIDFMEYAVFQMSLFILAGILEVPTGVFSDTIGRKFSLVVSELIYLTAMLLLVLFPAKSTVVLCAILYPLGSTLGSGNLSGIAFEVFKRENCEEEYKNVLSKGMGIQLLCGSLAALAGGYLAQYYLALPMMIDTVLLAISILLTVLFLENDKKSGLFEKIEAKGFKKGISTLSQALRHLKEYPHVFFLFLISAVFFASVRGLFVAYQPLLVQNGYSLESLGAVFFLLSGVSAANAFLSKKISDRFGSIPRFVIFMVVISFVSAVVLWISSDPKLFVLIAIVLHQCIRGLYGPFFLYYSNNNIPPGFPSRSTLLSISNLVSSLFCGLCILLVGFLSKKMGYREGFIVTSFLLGICSLVFLAGYQKCRFSGSGFKWFRQKEDGNASACA